MHCRATVGGLLLGAAIALGGCTTGGQPNYQRLYEQAQSQLKDRDTQIANLKAAIEQQQRQLATATGLSDTELKTLFFPDHIEIDSLSGGEHYEGGPPGDNGVTVYLKPVDRYGDTIKAAGDIHIQLYDLANPQGQELVGECSWKADQVARLWQSAFFTAHFVVKCPWQHGPPKHEQITIRATFIDYLTKRAMTAQAVGKVHLGPAGPAPATAPSAVTAPGAGVRKP
jgi:hypothetical protein